MAYGVEVDEVAKVLRAAEQRAVVTSEPLPSSMKVVGHHIDEVQFPDLGTKPSEAHVGLFLQREELNERTYLAISAISYPPSMVPFPADTAAVNMS